MKAPLIFCSTSHSINVQKIFKIVLSKGRSFSRHDTKLGADFLLAILAFDLKCALHLPFQTRPSAPLTRLTRRYHPRDHRSGRTAPHLRRRLNLSHPFRPVRLFHLGSRLILPPSLQITPSYPLIPCVLGSPPSHFRSLSLVVPSSRSPPFTRPGSATLYHLSPLARSTSEGQY